MKCECIILVLTLLCISPLVPATEEYETLQSGENGTMSSPPSSYFHGSRDLPLIALTYDDGPNKNFTPRLIKVLREHDAPATFFWLGEQVEYYPDVARYVIEMGFEIGNHSFDHANLAKRSIPEIKEQIRSTRQTIQDTVGITPRLFRPPYGAVNRTLRGVAAEFDLDVIMWSLDTEDWRTSCTKEKIVNRVKENIRPGDIILMHDRNTRTIEATAELIPYLRNQGYRFVTVSQLLQAQRYSPEIRDFFDSPLPQVLDFSTLFLKAQSNSAGDSPD